jgi:hypothetical protein
MMVFENGLLSVGVAKGEVGSQTFSLPLTAWIKN